MDALFLRILNMSMTAGYTIAVVALVRLLFKKLPAVFSYALWAVVLFRLVCPFSFESMISLMPLHTQTVPADIATARVPQIHSGVAVLDRAVNAALPAAQPYASANPLQLYLPLAAALWLAGLLVLVLHGTVSTLRLSRRLRAAQPAGENVLRLGGIPTPFVFGLIHPHIYLPADMDDARLPYILAHEQAHINRLDHLVKPLAYLVLCVHWFNPLAWLAFYLMERDMERCCDEHVLQNMGPDSKTAYSSALLSLAAGGRRFPSGSPLAFGESGIKARIKGVLRYKKPAFWAAGVALLVVAGVCIGLALNPHGGSPLAVTFPAYQDGRTQNNAHIYGTQAFLLSATLPDGWTLRLPPKEERTPQKVFTPVYLYEGDDYRGFVGFNTFEQYGDVPSGDRYKAVYSSLRMGSLSRLDGYTPVFSSDTAETALATMYERVEVEGKSAAEWPETEFPGILHYDLGRQVYVVIQLEPGVVTASEQKKLAKSIRLSAPENGTQALFAHRTEYVGDNSAVGGILGALSFPEGIATDGFELSTAQQPYMVTVNLKTDTETRNYYTGALHEAPFQTNACILFSLIKNLDIVSFSLNDGINMPYDLQYTSDWARDITGENLWEKSKTPEGLETLLTEIPKRINATLTGDDGTADTPPLPFAFRAQPETAEVIGQTAATVWLDSFKEGRIPLNARISDYEIEKVSVISGTPKAGQTRAEMAYHYVVRVNYSITTASEQYRSPGAGIAGSGTFNGVFCELCVKELGNGSFEIVSVGTGGGEQEFAPQEQRVYYDNLSDEDEALYQRLTQEKGLMEWQVHSLANTGFTFEDMLALPDGEIKQILAPGSSFMGDYMSEEETHKLIASGLPEDDVYVLNNLGYDYSSASALTPKQLDFIFPNTELVDSLVALGYDRGIVEASGSLYDGGWETYKELLDDVFLTHQIK